MPGCPRSQPDATLYAMKVDMKIDLRTLSNSSPHADCFCGFWCWDFNIKMQESEIPPIPRLDSDWLANEKPHCFLSPILPMRLWHAASWWWKKFTLTWSWLVEELHLGPPIGQNIQINSVMRLKFTASASVLNIDGSIHQHTWTWREEYISVN